MQKTFARNNKILMSIIIFMSIFVFVNVSKPSFLYNSNGTIREFGVGYRNKTILPLWLFSIVLGILSYILVMYYVTY